MLGSLGLRLGCVQVTLARNRHNGRRGETLPPFVNPTVLITRPQDASERFLAALAQSAGMFQIVILPAFEIVAAGSDMPAFDAAIFTSRAGVSFAPDGRGRTAYCVGDATADAATRAGYVAISAGGSAADLCAVILGRKPVDRLLHIRGEVSLGDVSATLRAGGLDCADFIAYRKDKQAVNREELVDLDTQGDLIIPLFSAETVSILASWPFDFSGAHLVAISGAVAQAAAELSPLSIVVCDHPDLSSMVAQTARLIA